MLFGIPPSFLNQHKSYLIECLILSLPDGKLFSRFSKKFLVVAKDLFIFTSLSDATCCAILKAAIRRCKDTEILLDLSLCIRDKIVNTENFQCGNVFINLLIEFIGKISLFNVNENLRKYKNAIIEIILCIAKIDDKTLSLSKLLAAGLKDRDEEEDEDNIKRREHEKICSFPSSMLMQKILSSFSPVPTSITQLFVSLSVEELLKLSLNSKASRVIDCFMSCKNMPDKMKITLFTKLSDDEINEMAGDKFGSRVLDSVWLTSNRQLIDLIKTKLESKKSTLKYHRIGKFIISKFFGYCAANKTVNDNGKKNKKMTVPNNQKLTNEIKKNNNKVVDKGIKSNKRSLPDKKPSNELKKKRKVT